MNRIIALIALPLVLGGCEQKAEKSTVGAAGAEVLPGSVSDAMLDTDQSRAQAPLAVVKPAVDASRAPQDALSPEDSAPSADDAPIPLAISAAKPAAAPSASAAPKPTAP